MSIARMILIAMAIMAYLFCGLMTCLFGEGANPETGRSLSAWWILFWPLRIFL